jgi:hypothetical protein
MIVHGPWSIALRKGGAILQSCGLWGEIHSLSFALQPQRGDILVEEPRVSARAL